MQRVQRQQHHLGISSKLVLIQNVASLDDFFSFFIPYES